MRARDPHDDPPAKRRTEPYRGQPVTLGHMYGCRRLLIYCSNGLYSHHSATVDADRWPDDTAVRDLCPKAVCTRCGIIGADVRPDWTELSKRVTGARNKDFNCRPVFLPDDSFATRQLGCDPTHGRGCPPFLP
jgi:hypothetical protein